MAIAADVGRLRGFDKENVVGSHEFVVKSVLGA